MLPRDVSTLLPWRHAESFKGLQIQETTPWPVTRACFSVFTTESCLVQGGNRSYVAMQDLRENEVLKP